MKETSGQKNFVAAGKQEQDNTSYHELKAKYPKIYNWFNTVPNRYLSETGFRNVSSRFGISANDLKYILAVFEKGGSK